MTWTKALGLAVSFSLLPACSDDHEDEDYELIIDNNGSVPVHVTLWSWEDMYTIEDHDLAPFEVISMWMSDDTLEAHPDLWISTDSGEHSLINLTLHRSYFSVPDLKFRVNVYP